MKKTSKIRNIIAEFTSSSTGFTLIELLVVISIIGLLSSIVLASVTSAKAKARDATRLSDMKQIRNALELFYADHDHYPGPTGESVSASGEFIGVGSPIDTALSSYMRTIPKDPLYDGVTYFYSYDPQHCSDSVPASCDCLGGTKATLAFNKAESSSFQVNRATCSGGDKGVNAASYNIVLDPYGP